MITVSSTHVGSVALTTLLDGAGVICPLDQAFSGPTEEDWEPYRALYPELVSSAEWRLPVACPLLRAAGRSVLVDAGVGPPGWWDFWRPELEGCLPGSLRDAGLRDGRTVWEEL